MRKLLDSVATNNEVAALDMMRAAEQLQDEVLRQRLLNQHDSPTQPGRY